MLDSALRNILRKIDEADAGFFGFRLLERLADYFGNDLRLADLNIPIVLLSWAAITPVP